MDILVIGLGLIGGSFCKAISARTSHNVYGYDTNFESIKKAIDDRAIISQLNPTKFYKADLTLICLHPKISVKVFKENIKNFRTGTIIADVCGVKENVVAQMSETALENGLRYVGTHPMAGREVGGYDNALETLYDRASFIVTPVDSTDPEALKTVKDLALETGFARIVETTPVKHDKTIAYTSQLAHIVSSAYVKSPSIENESGFTAGSFQDMTRIATVNENMWTDLFMQNREPLLSELDILIENLGKYKTALENADSAAMTELLREGRLIKEHDLITYSQK